MVNSRAKGLSDAHSFCWHHNRITSLFIWYDCIRSRMLNGWVFSVNEKVLILVNLWTCSNKGCYRNSATNENNYNYKLYKECPTLDYSTNFNLSLRQIKLIGKITSYNETNLCNFFVSLSFRNISDKRFNSLFQCCHSINVLISLQCSVDRLGADWLPNMEFISLWWCQKPGQNVL